MDNKKLKIAFVSSEAVPFAKTGGLADVAGSLPKVLEELGCEVKLFVPKYDRIDEDKFGLTYCWDIGEMPISVAGHVRAAHLHQAKLPDSNVEVNFIDCPHFFHRGYIYSNDADEDERFILFCKGVFEAIQRLNWVPDIIHCNDWQTGLIPLYLKDNYSWDKKFSNVKSIFTIHNIGYQGNFPFSAVFNAEIGEKHIYSGGPIEPSGRVLFLKLGIQYADLISTVSKTYAKEILTEQYGAGLDGILRSRGDDVYGIINGIDYTKWDPATDTHIPYNYSAENMEGKLRNKKYLLEHFNLKYVDNVPLVGMVSRMADQKGFDIFEQAAPGLLDLNAQYIVLGSGESKYEDLFRSLAAAYPNQFIAYIGFNNELSHIIEAGADMFLMPSLYEPCGLNQIYSLKYGTVPIVRKTGGLADTVQDWHEKLYLGEESGTGFSFNDYSSYALYSSVQRAMGTYIHNGIWKKIQLNGMTKDYSWRHSAIEYVDLYNNAILNK